MQLVHRNTSGPLPTSIFDLVGYNGTVLGFAQVRHKPSQNADLPHEAGSNLYYEIGAPYRRVGYGKELMRFALKEAKRIGLHEVRLTVLDDNPVSRHIIKSNGGVWVKDFVCRRGERYHLFRIDLAQRPQAKAYHFCRRSWGIPLARCRPT
jgi:predicted acetyltransferase